MCVCVYIYICLFKTICRFYQCLEVNSNLITSAVMILSLIINRELPNERRIEISFECYVNSVTSPVRSYFTCMWTGNKVRELATMCLPWQSWTKALVWFDDVDIPTFQSCVVDLWQSLAEWHLLMSACLVRELYCRPRIVQKGTQRVPYREKVITGQNRNYRQILSIILRGRATDHLKRASDNLHKTATFLIS